MSTWDYLGNYLQHHNITYKEYLQSEHWYDVRNRFYKSKLCKNRCEACGNRDNLNLHHKTYKRIGQEWLNDLVLLCHSCHKSLHKIEKEKRAKNPRSHLWGITRKFIRHGSVSQKRKSRMKRRAY